MEFTPPFGRWLKQQRQALDLTQEDFAGQIGYSIDTLRKLESGARRPSHLAAEHLADHLQISAPDRPAFLAFARGTGGLRWGLTLPPTSLVGRVQEIHLALEMLGREEVRLLNLVGLPGVGKTRLAQEVVRQASDALKVDTCFVRLASIRDPNRVGDAIAETLQVRLAHDRPVEDALVGYLANKQMLLLLDNFEHLPSAASLVATLLARAPALKILVTSRTVLHLAGEHVFEVAPLATPAREPGLSVHQLMAYPAIELFVEKARQAKPSFALTKYNAGAVSDLCRSLDGLPLAIELAAAHIRAFTPQTILLRLDHRAGAKLQFLNTGSRDYPPRQQTLRATIDWSYDLLSADEQAVFRQLSVFVGGFTLEAVEAVCDVCGAEIALSQPSETATREKRDIARVLESLVEQNLVQEREDVTGESRYTILETIREYALERLEASGEAESIRRRHARYFSRKCELDVNSPAWPIVCTEHLKGFARERDNLYAAMGWSKGYVDEPILHLRISMVVGWLTHTGNWYWGVHGDARIIESEIAWSLERNPDISPALRSMALACRGLVLQRLGDHEEAARIESESLTLGLSAGTLGIAASAAHVCGQNADAAGDFGLAEQYFTQELELGERISAPGWVLNGLSMVGHLALERGDLDRAGELLERALALAHSLGIKTDILGGQAVVLQDLGLLAYEQGDYAKAYELGNQALFFFEEEGEIKRHYSQHRYLGWAALAQQRTSLAEFHLTECLHIAREYDLPVQYALALLAQTAAHRGDMTRYAQLMGAVTGGWIERSRIKSFISIQEQNRCQTTFAEAKKHLSELAFTAAWAMGQAMTMDQAVAYALQDGEADKPPEEPVR